MVSPVPTTPTPLATAADFIARFKELAQGIDPEVIADLMVEATAHIETLTSRRFAPFTGHLYSELLTGIYPDEYGSAAGLPLDIYGSLGQSYADALGANDLVRHIFLDQFAPHRPELWSYTIESITATLTYGNTIDLTNHIISGPSPTDGHLWLQLGTFTPIGTRVDVTYSGGYTGGIPADLKRACLFQAAKFATLENEQQLRQGKSLEELDTEIQKILAGWARA